MDDVRRRPQGSRDLELLESMIEGASDGLWIVSSQGTLLDGNHIAEELSGLRRSVVVGRNVTELRGERTFDWSIVAEVIAAGRAVTQVQTFEAGRKLLVAGRPVPADDGNARYVVLTLRDVTDVDRLVASVRETKRLSERYQRELRSVEARERHARRIVACSEAMRAVQDLALRYATIDSPVLLLGETGVGKGVVSRLIHEASPRAGGPFLEVNCGAIPDGLVEAELFGYARGAFTGADARGKTGLVELARSGTLVLDEIGDLPLALQVKLLRLLEDGEIWPVGAVASRRPDVRILAATNRDLPAMIARGEFRPDLYYRLNVLTLRIPPLRERPEDIAPLAETMLAELERRLHRTVMMSPAALGAVSSYAFPGNVRELRNLIERLAITMTTDVVEIQDLPPEICPRDAIIENGRGCRADLREALRGVEVGILRDALKRYRTQARAAAHLGVSQATVARRAKRYGIKAASEPS